MRLFICSDQHVHDLFCLILFDIQHFLQIFNNFISFSVVPSSLFFPIFIFKMAKSDMRYMFSMYIFFLWIIDYLSKFFIHPVTQFLLGIRQFCSMFPQVFLLFIAQRSNCIHSMFNVIASNAIINFTNPPPNLLQFFRILDNRLFFLLCLRFGLLRSFLYCYISIHSSIISALRKASQSYSQQECTSKKEISLYIELTKYLQEALGSKGKTAAFYCLQMCGMIGIFFDFSPQTKNQLIYRLIGNSGY